MSQNTSHAVMAQRVEPLDSADDFPTPPWATRALIEHVIGKDDVARRSCLEPACGRGYMSTTLREYFKSVEASDAYDYGTNSIVDFIDPAYSPSVDWVISNPSFRLAEAFVKKALRVSSIGVAMLCRSVFLESVGRYRGIFEQTPPTDFAPFVERVPMVRGRVDAKASTATSYAWFVWERGILSLAGARVVFIPPCRKALERPGDYDPR